MSYYKFISIFISGIIFLGLFSGGCQKSPINRDLDGFWQVMDVNPETEDIVLDSRIYYAFNLHVCVLSFYGGDFTVGNMKFIDNKLYLDFPHANSTESIFTLRQYGIYTNPVVFKVSFPSKNKMILYDSENDVSVYLRRF